MNKIIIEKKFKITKTEPSLTGKTIYAIAPNGSRVLFDPLSDIAVYKCETNNWKACGSAGSRAKGGRFYNSSTADVDALEQICRRLGVKFERGNDSPRGGRAGEWGIARPTPSQSAKLDWAIRGYKEFGLLVA